MCTHDLGSQCTAERTAPMFSLQAAFMKRAHANGQASMGKFGGEGTANGGDSLYEANYKY